MAKVIHISGQVWIGSHSKPGGRPDFPAQQRYHAFPYLHEEMGAALASATWSSPARAIDAGEFPFFGLPHPVPYPHAWATKSQCRLTWSSAARSDVKDELLMDVYPVIKDLLTTHQASAMSKAMKSLLIASHKAIVGQIIQWRITPMMTIITFFDV